MKQHTKNRIAAVTFALILIAFLLGGVKACRGWTNYVSTNGPYHRFAYTNVLYTGGASNFWDFSQNWKQETPEERAHERILDFISDSRSRQSETDRHQNFVMEDLQRQVDTLTAIQGKLINHMDGGLLEGTMQFIGVLTLIILAIGGIARLTRKGGTP